MTASTRTGAQTADTWREEEEEEEEDGKVQVSEDDD